MNSTHDFGDNRGQVHAQRHIYPDGSLGYWLPRSWSVKPDQYVLLDITKVSQRISNEFHYIKIFSANKFKKMLFENDMIYVWKRHSDYEVYKEFL